MKKKTFLLVIILGNLVNACGVQSNLVIPMNTSSTQQTPNPSQTSSAPPSDLSSLVGIIPSLGSSSSTTPTATSSTEPTSNPIGFPSLPTFPSSNPTSTPTATPTAAPSTEPTSNPTGFPSLPPLPSSNPTSTPTAAPSTAPTSNPTGFPSLPPLPSSNPTSTPTATPTATPSTEPTSNPTGFPSLPPLPSSNPTSTPTATPTSTPKPTPFPTPTPTATPVPPVYKIIGSSSVSIGNSYWNKAIIRIDATLVSDKLSVKVSKIDGTSFTTASDVYLKVGTYETYGVNHVVSRIIIGEKSIILSDNIGRYSWSESTKKFYVRLQDSAGSWSWAGPITVGKY